MNQKIATEENFALENFKGPLDFLLHLIQREEIDLYEVSLHDLTKQFLEKWNHWQEGHLAKGAPFIGTTAYLIWLKSKILLPHTDKDVEEFPFDFEDPQFEIIHHLVEYCRFKQASQLLSKRYEEQNGCFTRGYAEYIPPPKPFGIDHLSLEDLALVFRDVLQRAPLASSPIYEESWKVADKLRLIQIQLQSHESLDLREILDQIKSRVEVIVTFLAILELMKREEIVVVKKRESQNLFLQKRDKS